MFCKWCGAELPFGAVQCKRCNREVPPLSDCGGFYDFVPAARPVAAQNVSEEKSTVRCSDEERGQEALRRNGAQKPPKRRRAAYLEGICCVLLICLLILCWEVGGCIRELRHLREDIGRFAVETEAPSAPTAEATGPTETTPAPTEQPTESTVIPTVSATPTEPSATLPETTMPTDVPGIFPGI